MSVRDTEALVTRAAEAAVLKLLESGALVPGPALTGGARPAGLPAGVPASEFLAEATDAAVLRIRRERKALQQALEAAGEDDPESVWRLPAVLRATSLSRSSLYRAIAAGTFPRGFHLGRRRAWLRVDVERWIAEQQEQTAA